MCTNLPLDAFGVGEGKSRRVRIRCSELLKLTSRAYKTPQSPYVSIPACTGSRLGFPQSPEISHSLHLQQNLPRPENTQAPGIYAAVGEHSWPWSANTLPRRSLLNFMQPYVGFLSVSLFLTTPLHSDSRQNICCRRMSRAAAAQDPT